jgi:hypothetical protein
LHRKKKAVLKYFEISYLSSFPYLGQTGCWKNSFYDNGNARASCHGNGRQRETGTGCRRQTTHDRALVNIEAIQQPENRPMFGLEETICRESFSDWMEQKKVNTS